MRQLSKAFKENLKTGFLSGILNFVKEDYDLDFQIRDNYINIYFKGNSLLKLSENKSRNYIVEINEKFLEKIDIPKSISNTASSQKYIDCIPSIKENILKYGKHSLETEYEQLIIRANNSEFRNNSDFFIIDRQYVDEKKNRYDLTGFYWKQPRRKNQEVNLCFMEVKFGLNSDIKEIHKQISRYYESTKLKAIEIVEEAEVILRQKLELDLFDQDIGRLEAMKTLRISSDISTFQFIIFLIDFNPNSKLFNLEKLKELPFANQIRLFKGGFAMWEQNTNKIIDKS